MKIPSRFDITLILAGALLFSLACHADVCDSGNSNTAGDDPFHAHSDQPHQVQVIDQGTADLEKKLEMISGAQKSLDLEYFVFGADQSGRLVLQALLKRATDKTRPPINIRMMVDHTTSGKGGITPDIAQVLINAGVQVKYFNPGSKADFSKYDHRDHRKLMIADATPTGGEFCGGGRNMADDYLDLGKARTRHDRDACVKGPLANSVESTFQTFWGSPLAKLAAKPAGSPDAKTPSAAALDIFTTSPQDTKLLGQVHQVGSDMLKSDPTYNVNSISFVSDHPELDKSGHIMADTIENFLHGTQDKVTIENMLYMPTAQEKAEINLLSAQGKDVTILTDAPKAADNRRISLLALNPEKNAVSQGAKIYLQSGRPQDGQVFLSPDQDPNTTMWGTHTKTIVRDSRDTSIGSFNFDSRSANINFEDQIVVCNQPDLAKAVESDIQARAMTAYQLDKNGNFSNCPPPSDATPGKAVNFTIESVMKVFNSQY
jgi:putative cardiolipin synthase